MEKIRLLHRSPLFASTSVLSASFRICSCPKQRLLSSMDSNRTGQLAKKQSGMYPGVPVSELVRGWFLYNLFRSNYFVDNGLQIMKYTKSILGWSLTERLLKATIFSQFVAEDTDKELTRKVQLYDQRKVGMVFAYTSEPLEEDQMVGEGLTPEKTSELQEAKHDKKCAKCLESIDKAAHYTKGRPHIAAMKITSIVEPKLLERLTALLNYSDKVFNSQCTATSGKKFPSISKTDMCFKSQALQHAATEFVDKSSKKGIVDIIDWQNHFSVENLEQLHLVLEEELSGVEKPPPLSLQEHKQMKDLMKRLNDLGERAATRNVRLLMDAEQTYYQPAIRSLVVHYLMKRYNQDQPIIYNTLQSYLKSSYRTLLMEHTTAKRNNNIYAVKVVRGAYLYEERRLAQEQDPIHSDKMATDSSYDRNIDYLLSKKDSFLFVASHNLESVIVAKKQSSSDEYREIVEAKCNKVSHHYLKSIDHAAHYTKGRPPIIAIKLTAIVDYSILDRLTRILNYSDKVFMSQSDQTCDESHLLMDRHVSCANMSFESEVVQEMVRNLADKSSTEGKLDIVDWQNHFTVENIDQLHLLLEEQLPGVERPAPLTHQEHEQLNNLLKRLNDIGERAGTRNVRVLIDAEQTYYQPAIRNMSLHYLMKKYSTEHPVIYDTIQSYLKISYRTLLMGHATAQRNNSTYAIKLVRGAYMDEEGRLAQEQGYENPIHPNKDATDASYHKNIDYLLSNNVHTFVASHNNESTKLAKKKMSTYDISPLSGQVVFGQLLGMADYVSSPLAHDGYLVYKLLPYGVVREVVPYLARRAQENRGAMKSAQIERELLGKEIRQRLLLVFSGR